MTRRRMLLSMGAAVAGTSALVQCGEAMRQGPAPPALTPTTRRRPLEKKMEVIKRVRPTPSNEYLANPHKGCCTFQRFNGDPLFPGTRWSEEGPVEFPPLDANARWDFLGPQAPPVAGYLPTTVSYCRWFWRLMEPQKGQYDFGVLEKSLATAQARGQTLTIRLMAFGSRGQPQLPEWFLAKYPTQQDPMCGNISAPVYDGPDFLEQWGRFVREAGRRFDGHPLLDSIDVAYLGPWGEGAGACSPETHRAFHGMFKEAWPKTQRLSAINEDQLQHGMQFGEGFRMDSFGDLSNRGSVEVPKNLSWNHHFDCYPRAISRFARDAWKKAPVHLESGWVPMGWHQRGFDLDFILEQGLKYHATYFMPKSSAMPEAWMGKLTEFCKKLGYRFVLRQVIYELAMQRGKPFGVECWIDNVGVAPIYRGYTFAFRLRHGDKSVILPVAQEDIRNWLPGDNWVITSLAIPADFPAGPADLSCGIIDPKTHKVVVKFAVKERYSDGWTAVHPVVIG